MELILIIWKSLKNQKKRNIFMIVELTLSFFVIFVVSGRIEYYNTFANKEIAIMNKDYYKVSSSNITNKDDYNLTKFSFIPKYETDITPTSKIYEIAKNDNRVDTVGRLFGTVLKPSMNNPNEIKANVLNLLAIFDDKPATKLFDYKVIKGENFTQYYEKYKKTDDTEAIPLLIGPPLEKLNPIGSVVQLPGALDYKTFKPIRYKVIGILDPSMPTGFEPGTFDMRLDNNGYVTIGAKLPSDQTAVDKEIFYTVLITVKSKTDIEQIEKDYTEKIKTHKISLDNVKDYYRTIKKDGERNYTGIFYGVIMLLLSSFGIISISFSTLLKRKREIGIRFAVGAKKSNIAIMIGGELFFLYIVSGVISLPLAKGVEKIVPQMLISMHVVFIASSMVISFMLLSTIPLVVKTFKLNIMEFIKVD
ncbi:ABC transporter permease [Clostridium sp. C8-1-8]|uniref:ABC transporter permease n=1 Tax=Clostridium sp. C8-1-8 TaxID=2698831 RepID=UPI001372084B|nr:ABC transporter permease [Clostridium sp. C8-1-8]